MEANHYYIMAFFYLLGLPFAFFKEFDRLGEDYIPEILVIGAAIVLLVGAAIVTAFYPIMYIIALPITYLKNLVISKKGSMMVENSTNDKKIKRGDWVRVSGEGAEAFKVKWVKGQSVALCNGCTEPLYKITKLDLNEYEISSYTTYYWRERE